jgi:hypothetical protein
MGKPIADPGMKCPLWQKDQSEVCHTCDWYIHIRGKHPQSEEAIDRWGCAVSWMPFLTIENSQMQRQTGAAVESFRNEVVRLGSEVAHDALPTARRALLQMLGAACSGG